MENRNLIIVTFSYFKSNGGGVESWLQKFLHNIGELENYYSRYEIIGLNDGSESFVKNVKNNKISFKLIDVKRHSSFLILPSFIKQVKSVVKKQKDALLDIVFIGSNYPSLPILFLKKNKKIRKYIWLRSFFPKEIYSTGMAKFRKFFLKLEHKALKKANFIIANGNDTKCLYENYYNDLPEIVTIPNAIDRTLVKPNETPLSHKKIKIAFVSRLEIIKGFDIFCESIEIVNELKSNNDFEFYIVGEGTLSPEAYRISKKYVNVFYKGIMPNNEVYTFLSRMDCSVLLGRFSEKLGGSGLSNSLLEAVFSNNLIIANDSKGYRQTLNDDAAIFVREGDANLLAETYLEVDTHRDDNKMRIKNAVALNSNYDFEHHMNTFLQLMNR